MGNRSRMHNGKDSRRYYDWLEHSSQDLIAAKILSEDDRCYRLAAFHCQQAIEKALKDPGVIEKFEKIGLSADYLPAKEFGDRIKSSSDLADEVLAGRKSLD